jgi:5-methylcytosine-specific restriction enzyme A
MPSAAPRACPVPGCPSLVTRDRPCPTHARPAWTGAGRGSTRAWRLQRHRVLATHDGLCALCRAEGFHAFAVVVDHIVPVSQGGSDDDANLQPLCYAHNVAKTARESRQVAPARVRRGR